MNQISHLAPIQKRRPLYARAEPARSTSAAKREKQLALPEVRALVQNASQLGTKRPKLPVSPIPLNQSHSQQQIRTEDLRHIVPQLPDRPSRNPTLARQYGTTVHERSRLGIIEQKKRREREKLGLTNLVTSAKIRPEDERVIKDMLYEKKGPVRMSNGRLRITNLSPPKHVTSQDNPYDQEDKSVYYRKFRQN